MATRSMINFIEVEGKKQSLFASLYKHFDGQLNWMGKTIADFLASKRLIVNYQVITEGNMTEALGIGCLVAQFLAENKEGAGDLYLLRPSKKNMQMEGSNVSYIYNVFVTAPRQTTRQTQEGGYRIEVIASDGVLFEGALKDYLAFISADIELDTLYNDLYSYASANQNNKVASALLRVLDARENAYSNVPHPTNYGKVDDRLLADLDAIESFANEVLADNAELLASVKKSMRFIDYHWEQFVEQAPLLFSAQQLNSVEVMKHYTNLMQLLPLLKIHAQS